MGPNQSLLTVDVGLVETGDTARRYHSALISGSMGMRLLWACARGKEALEHFCCRPARVVLVSLFLSDMTGIDLIKRLRLEWPKTLPILMIPQNQSRRAVEALEAGACGYVPTPCPAEDLIRAIRTVHDGGAILEQPVASVIVDYFRARGSVIDQLTEREREVLICLCEGLSQQEVTAKLGIGKETVRTHVRNLLGKLGARSTNEALAFYLNPKPHGTRAYEHRVPDPLEEDREMAVGQMRPPSNHLGAAAPRLSWRIGPNGRQA